MNTGKWWFPVAAVLAVVVLVVGAVQPASSAENLESLWRKVDDAQRNGLPKTAVTHLKKIVPLAVKHEEYGQALKALCKQLVFEANIQGNKPEEKITRLHQEIKQAPENLRILMKLVLARWYWHYYEQNRWRFQQRTETAGMSETDFTTWDLPKLFNQIDEFYTEVLSHESRLKGMSMDVFQDFFTRGNLPLAYRPTLYDFAAFSAIGFYQSGDQIIKKPEDAFEMAADSDAFAPAEIFTTYQPDTTDTSSPLLKAMKIYKKLLEFHQHDSRSEAFVDADINRLVFVNSYSFGELKSERFIKRLSEIADRYESLPLASLACYHWAQELYNQGDYTAAHRVAERGRKLHPDSPGGHRCRDVIIQIEAKELDLKCEYSVTPSFTDVRLDYRNIDRVHFRVVEDRWDDFLEKRWSSPSVQYMDHKKQLRLLNKTPVASWSVPLTPTADYNKRSQDIELPSLKPGFYRLIASWREDFAGANNAIRIASFWVTRLAVVVRQRDDGVEGFVMDAHSGKPLSRAEVRVFRQDSEGYYRKAGTEYTDDNGFFRVDDDDDHRGLALFVKFGKNELLYPDQAYPGGRYSVHSSSQTIFFTDRSIYRPGQTIHFKVLAIQSDHRQDTYEFLPNRQLQVVFRDYNWQEIERLKLTTNAFGSASGSFTAPSGTITGRMTIQCDNLNGSTSVNVEEYKRPKFRVEIEAPKEEGRLDQEITLTGSAMAYTGAPIDQGKVSFRVVRRVRYPWWCWWCWGRPSSTREITHGKLNTDEQGRFTLSFVARPDKTVLKADDPTFSYQVTVDVTDSTGETRSAERTLNVGYKSMVLDMSTPGWLTGERPVAVTIASKNLDGQPVKSKGTVEIFRLKEPARPKRSSLFGRGLGIDPRAADESNWKTWELAERLQQTSFDTAEGATTVDFTLEPGVYKVVATAQDRYGEEVKGVLPVMVIDPKARKLMVSVPSLVTFKATTLEVGDTMEALWATGYKKGQAFIEIEHKGRIVKSFWTNREATQQRITWRVDEEHRGGFFLNITHVNANRAYLSKHRLTVPWSNKKLEVSFATFRSKLQPGSKETWTVKIKGPGSEAAAAEMVAALYDASLDAFLPHAFRDLSGMFRQDYSTTHSWFANRGMTAISLVNDWNPHRRGYNRTYWTFPYEVLNDFVRYAFPYHGGRVLQKMSRSRSFEDGAPMVQSEGMELCEASMAPGAPREAEKKEAAVGGEADKAAVGKPEPEKKKKIDLTAVSARTNLNETAFFFPHLVSDDDGMVSMTFTMPEALTEWNFLGFAHASGLASGLLTGKTVTQKDLMVQPNPPRFLREGDVLLFTAKVTNMSGEEQAGTIRLTLTDTMTGKKLDETFGNARHDKKFSVPAKRSRTYSWKLEVPDYSGVLTYRVVASTGALSDGEENTLPVLSRRVFVTESLPLPIRGPETKTFTFDKLLESAKSDTLEHKALTVQVVSNPAWYAVQALPYLMEFPHECSEQVFNRLYANSLARAIANSSRKIKRIFSLWKGTDSLQSNLEKNQDLKSVMLEETPWVLAAQNEAAGKRRVGLLFDDNHMEDALSRAYEKLKKMQLSDGAWPWFPGGRPNSYITLYVMTGFGRLLNMDIEVKQDLALKSLDHLDRWIDEIYDNIKRHGHLERNNLSSTIAMYLYGRSFYLSQRQIPGLAREAVDYFLGQASEYWLQLNSRLSQGHLALACKRFGDKKTPAKIMASLKERSVTDEEMGMFWRDLELSWWWYRAPIETHAVMIEAFDEVAGDKEAVEDLKVWLIKQKQTQDWKTSKATADAVYGLLRRGANLLASDELVRAKVGDLVIKPEKTEAGTGFYEQKFVGEEIKAEYGTITLKKVDEGVAWGSIHWQYMEDMSKVTPHKTPLHLEKSLFVKRETKRGQVIEPVQGSLAVGDLVKVRIVLRVDRDMEYVHMKDFRGSGTEPVNVLSHYKYQDGLAYYEATRDTATHFFIEYLPKGTYVFEYPLRIQHRGRYQMGMATIQCMYAPEFNSHSASEFVEVK